MHLATDTAVVPVRTYMQRIRRGSGDETRPAARRVSRHTTHPALSSMGRQRLRPSAMTCLITDIHTHTPGDPQRIYNLDPTDSAAASGYLSNGLLRSVGIHPWRATLATPDMLDRLEQLASDPATLIVGETGLDTLRGPDMAIQTTMFEHHAALAQSLGKPLLIHAVRSWNEILDIHHRLRSTVPWIIHGFRGKPQLARQLLGHGLWLSLGEHFNPSTIKAIPPDKLLAETDESHLSPAEIATSLGTSTAAIATNINRITGQHL